MHVLRLPRTSPKRLLLACGALAGLALMPVLPALAITYGSGTYGTCQYGSGSCSITISSAGSVSLDVTPAGGGSCTTQSDTVSVLTDNPSGFTLSLADSNTNAALVNGTAHINPGSGTQANPVALTVNTWGYRVDGLDGFGAGPTSAQANTGLNGTLFAAVPASNMAADTLADTNDSADPAVNTSVWYSVCADTSVASGTYTSQVTYTAVTN